MSDKGKPLRHAHGEAASAPQPAAGSTRPPAPPCRRFTPPPFGTGEAVYLAERNERKELAMAVHRLLRGPLDAHKQGATARSILVRARHERPGITQEQIEGALEWLVSQGLVRCKP